MRVLLFFVVLSTYAIGQSDFKVVTIPKSKKSDYPVAQVEPSIAIDPNNPDRVAAGTVMNDYYFSKDGGVTWKSKILKSSYGVNGDPVLMFDNNGKLYYSHLSNPKNGNYLDRIVLQSTNRLCGRMSNGSFPIPNGTKAQDKQWTVVNPKNNEIYMTWTQFDEYGSEETSDSSIILFSKSTDSGKSWSTPKRISFYAGDCIDDDETVEGAVPAVGPNGEIYVTWTGPKGLVFQKSLDGGETWMEKEMFIEKQYGGWTLAIPGLFRANGLPILKCDLSEGPNKGTLYLNWCDQRNGEENTDVFVMKSTDGGNTWSEPIKVNQDTTNTHQFFTWMDIDQSTGNVYFVYYDRRNYLDENTDVYISATIDGGETFSDFRVSHSPFIPDAQTFFGDYLNIAAVNGNIRPIWPRMDNGKISLKVALIDESELQLR